MTRNDDVLPADWAAGQQQQAACRACGPRCPDHQPLTFADSITPPASTAPPISIWRAVTPTRARALRR